VHRLRLLLLTTALAACSTESKPPIATTGTGSPSQGAGGAGPDAGVSSCAFAAAASFELPALVDAPTPAFTQFASQLMCTAGGSKLTYELNDLNGDGQPDLVVTSACADPTVGVSAWLVYYNTGTGFASTPTRFALAPAIAPTGCAAASVLYLTGDRYPDYVVTSRCDDATVGSSRWLVYAGSADGFAQTAVPYALPLGYTAGAFTTTSVTTSACSGGKNVPVFSLFDLNGDGLADFVMTQSCSDPSIGTTAWQVFFGSASGAAQTATRFALPTTPPASAGAFGSTTGSLACTGGVVKPTYTLIDFNLDGKTDLVATQECSLANVGTSAWLFYPNSGSAFAPLPTTIALPTITGVPADSYIALSGGGTCANGSGAPTYTLAELAGDPSLALLVSRNCSDPLTGVSYWQVFSNTGSGFTALPVKLALPAVLGATSTFPAGLSGKLECTPPASSPAYTTTYLAGLTLNIVVTSACDDPSVGATRWLLYPASCE
jgi:hypothetical protein